MGDSSDDEIFIGPVTVKEKCISSKLRSPLPNTSLREYNQLQGWGDFEMQSTNKNQSSQEEVSIKSAMDFNFTTEYNLESESFLEPTSILSSVDESASNNTCLMTKEETRNDVIWSSEVLRDDYILFQGQVSTSPCSDSGYVLKGGVSTLMVPDTTESPDISLSSNEFNDTGGSSFNTTLELVEKMMISGLDVHSSSSEPNPESENMKSVELHKASMCDLIPASDSLESTNIGKLKIHEVNEKKIKSKVMINKKNMVTKAPKDSTKQKLGFKNKVQHFYDVVSPIHMYIHDQPAPLLVKTLKFGDSSNVRTTGMKKLLLNSEVSEATNQIRDTTESPRTYTSSGSSPFTLPVVKYVRQPAIVLKSTPFTPLNPPRKTSGVPKPLVTKHTGHVLCREKQPSSSNIDRLSILETRIAGKSNTLPNQ